MDRSLSQITPTGLPFSSISIVQKAATFVRFLLTANHPYVVHMNEKILAAKQMFAEPVGMHDVHLHSDLFAQSFKTWL